MVAICCCLAVFSMAAAALSFTLLLKTSAKAVLMAGSASRVLAMWSNEDLFSPTVCKIVCCLSCIVVSSSVTEVNISSAGAPAGTPRTPHHWLEVPRLRISLAVLPRFAGSAMSSFSPSPGARLNASAVTFLCCSWTTISSASARINRRP
jgi:hypothetical protein